MPTNFNVSPFFDDFDENNKFYRILYRPSFAVQARELTQQQSILQNQVKQFGDHIFEFGSMVIPGTIAYDLDFEFVKLQPTINSVNVIHSNFLGKIITGQTSGVVARVIRTEPAITGDPITLFVKYLNSGTNNSTQRFLDGEIITDGVTESATLEILNATGKGSAASITSGIYYIHGIFVKVDDQQIILDKYTNTPSFKTGLKISESIISPDDDNNLRDNAQGSPNFAAPGADRYKINLNLEKRSLTSIEEQDFIELLRLNQGNVIQFVRASNYSIIEQSLARRTFDESGNYAVKSFDIDVREHLDNGANRGVYNTLTTPLGDSTKLAIGIEPGKAFVNGFEIETLATKFVDVEKARDTAQANNAVTRANLGNFVLINNIFSIPDIDNLINVELRDTATATPGNSTGTQVGTARARGIELFSGIPGISTAQYKLFLFDIKMNIGKTFNNDVKQIFQNGLPSFSSDTVTTGTPLTTLLNDTGNNSLLFPLPFNVVKTVRAADSSVDTTYTVRRSFSGTLNSTGIISFTAGGNEVFAGFSSQDYNLTVTSGINQGQIIDLSGKVSLSGLPTGKNISINLGATFAAETVKVTTTIIKQIAQEKTKVSTTEQFIITTPTGSDKLNKADIIGIDNIFMSADLVTTPLITDLDVTDRYELDDGQRDNYYDLGKIILKVNQPAATGQLLVIFRCFNHGTGDYFSVDSYTGQVPFDQIPTFTSPNTGKTIELRDTLDFRPRVDNLGVDFNNIGSSLSEVIKSGTDIRVDFQYFLNRIDKIYLDFRGEFNTLKGVAELNPSPPSGPTDGMILFQLKIPAFTFKTSDIEVKFIDNRRFTMRDIGELEKRIDNLEFYTSLNLLEKETSNLQIKDINTGLDRFKNGFIVDNFTGHGIGDVLDDDYSCAIDFSNGELRPSFTESFVNLGSDFGDKSTPEGQSGIIEGEAGPLGTLNIANSTGFRKRGDLITLPATENIFIEQPFASRTQQINPHNIVTFLGSIKLDPPTDSWKDTARRPDVSINIEGILDSAKFLNKQFRSSGTIWNGWQLFHAGAPLEPNIKDRQTNEVRDEKFTRTSSTSRTTSVVNEKNTKTGIKSKNVPQIIRRRIEDRTLNIGMSSFIREKGILFKSEKMKANTKLFGFFDGVDLTSEIAPASDMIISNKIGDFQDNFGSNEIIVGMDSGAKAKIVLQESSTLLKIVNIEGTFNTNEIITGNQSNTTAIVGTITVRTKIDDLLTNNEGVSVGILTIPNRDNLRFRNGERIFRLTDKINNGIDAETSAEEIFRAQGILDTRMPGITSTRPAKFAIINPQETQIINRDITNEVASIGTSRRFRWNDPLSQTFLVSKEGGVAISKLELFFETKDDNNIPVTVQIRTVKNGFPGKRILPFSEVTLNPKDINISPNAQVSTTFEFQSPIFLEDAQEYSFVIISDSDKYKVWTARLGETMIGTNRTISRQPESGGLLFKSQNASTWVSDPMEKIKYRITSEEYSTVPASLIFENPLLPTKKLNNIPLQTTAGSTSVIVNHNDHNMPNGSSVTLSGVVGVGSPLNINGIPITELNTTHIISSVEQDSYIINMTTPAISSGLVGGNAILITENKQFDVMHLLSQEMIANGASIDWSIKTTSGRSTNGNQVPYIKDASFSNIISNDNTFFDSPRMIASGVNETSQLSGNKSLELQARLFTTNKNITPVIDLKRIGIILVNNRINNPTISNVSNFIDETAAKGGSSVAKYITRRIPLKNPAIALKILLTASRPSSSNIELYFRILKQDDSTPFEELPYIFVPNPDSIIDPSLNEFDFREYSYTIDNLDPFIALSVKIVMKGSNSSNIPRIKDFRAIALGT